MSNNITIKKSIQIAVRHPQMGAELLAQSVAKRVNTSPWVDYKMKVELSLLLLGFCLGGRAQKNINKKLLKRIKNKPFDFGIRYLKRDSDNGLRYLAALLIDELKDNQQMPQDEQVHFCKQIIKEFFPDIDIQPD